MPDLFSDVQFMSTSEKVTVLNAWKRFLKNELSFSCFTKALYHHLIQHCCFIAHYSRFGFYEYYFADHPKQALRFLSQFDKKLGNVSVEYGSDGWLTQADYHDINGAMVDVFELYKVALYQRLQKQAYEVDIAAAKTLLSRHGLKPSLENIEDGDVQKEPDQIVLRSQTDLSVPRSSAAENQLVLFREG